MKVGQQVWVRSVQNWVASEVDSGWEDEWVES